MALDNSIFDCGKVPGNKPLFTRKVPDGKGGVVGERVALWSNVMGVDPNGNVLPIRTHGASALKAQNDAYALTILQAKWAAGWIPLNECPQNSQHERMLPDEIKGRAKCRVAIDGGPIGRDRKRVDHWCQCVDTVIKARRAANAAVESERDPGLTVQQKLLAETQKQTQSATGSIDKMASTIERLMGAMAEREAATAAVTPKAGK